jgi:hypothetical protein
MFANAFLFLTLLVVVIGAIVYMNNQNKHNGDNDTSGKRAIPYKADNTFIPGATRKVDVSSRMVEANESFMSAKPRQTTEQPQDNEMLLQNYAWNSEAVPKTQLDQLSLDKDHKKKVMMHANTTSLHGAAANDVLFSKTLGMKSPLLEILKRDNSKRKLDPNANFAWGVSEAYLEELAK